MSDLRDLPDLARDVRERVVIPPYDDVHRRVRARRVRGAAGILAAVALVAGGVAVWQNVAETTLHVSPAGPDDDPLPRTDERMWRSVVDGAQAHPFEFSGTDDGSIAIVWRALEQPEPTYALVIRGADGTVHGRRLDEPVDLTPVPGGWVGVDNDRGWYISTDGTWTDLGVPAAAHRTKAGDVLVSGHRGRWMYSPADHAWSVAATSNRAADAYVAPRGHTVTCELGQGTVRGRGSRANRTIPGEGCLVEGNGFAVAVAGLGDGPAGALPLTGLLLSIDEGTTWTKFEDLPPGVSFTSLAITPDGTTVVTAEDRAFVFHPDGRYSELQPGLGVVTAAGDRLYATTYGLSKGSLHYSDDQGNTWHETTLPGRE